MQRRYRPLIGASVILLACSGCHLMPTGLAPDRSGQQARSERADSDASSGDDIRQAEFESDRRQSRKGIEQAAYSGDSDQSKAAEEVSLAKLELLNAELTDATPAERQQWYRMAAKLDPTELEMALRARTKPSVARPTNWGHTTDQGQATQVSHTDDRGGSSHSQASYGHGGTQLPIVTPGPSARSGNEPGSDDSNSNSSNRMSLIISDQIESLPDTVRTRPEQSIEEPPRAPVFGAPADPAPQRPNPVTQTNTTPDNGPIFGARDEIPRLEDAVATAPSATPTQRQPIQNPLPLPDQTDASVDDQQIDEAVDSLREVTELKSSLTAATWNEELRKLIDVAESDLAEMALDASNHDEYVKKHVNLRMMHLVAGEPNKAIRAIPGIESSEQEFWQQVLWAMSEYFADRTMPNHKDRVTETLSDLRRAIHRMRSQANLQVKNMNFCSRISSFGVYEKVGESRFRAGQQILIYAEIENFQSEEVVSSGAGVFKTRLSSTLEIHEAGESAQISTALRKESFSPTVDMCASPRRDYFNAYTYVLPNDLPPGQYSLRLMVRDELGAGIATERLNFEVVP